MLMEDRTKTQRAVKVLVDALLPAVSGSADSRLQQITARILLAGIVLDELQSPCNASLSGICSRIGECLRALEHSEPAVLAPDHLAMPTLKLHVVEARRSLPQWLSCEEALKAAVTVVISEREREAGPPAAPGFPPHSL